MEDIYKVSTEELDDIMQQFSTVTTEIELQTKGFLNRVRLLESDGIIQGNFAQNISAFANTLMDLLSDELKDIILAYSKEVGVSSSITCVNWEGFIDYIEQIDVYKKYE